ncbi:hypothetical protein FHS83_000463 [Rhizomicrobium palustre]|uniref:DUF1656 domain-containing protein n=1 Tax=Rhizomicrobium palustre TaxID=189966 RepID=A0A846MV94_9PROT|nr:DUF1656 domain-containing protein [Rhizomicrobium palustre]NIK87145.1 hypothetical protein [Rhizomicrobium palustre]
MIVDLSISGVFIPGLVIFALIALFAAMVILRVLAITGISRLFACRPLAEIATFLIIYGLLVQCLPLIGLLS